uniref:CBFD_NFYB_HMF domain-containing protein n=2 Tax=Steinernema glaseri TaxID=37863 RepID=A0A1I7YT30_9BILA
MTLTNGEIRPSVTADEEPYAESLSGKSDLSERGHRDLPSRKEVQERFLACATRHRIEEVEQSAADMVLASSNILLANIIESACRLRRNYLMEERGYTHSYGTTEQSIMACFGVVPVESIQRNKSNISARDLLEGIRFDKRLKLGGPLRSMLTTRLKSVVDPPKKQRKKRIAPSTGSEPARKVAKEAGGVRRWVEKPPSV